MVLIKDVTPAAAVASPAGGPGLSVAPTGSYGGPAPPSAARSASPGIIGGAIAGAVAGTGGCPGMFRAAPGREDGVWACQRSGSGRWALDPRAEDRGLQVTA